MGYKVEVRDRQEGVRRAMVAPTITQTDPAKIVFFDREVYGLKQRVFDCERISAQVTQEQCAASYLRNNIGSGCHNCSIGRHFSGGAPIAEDRHSAINGSLGLACIRCERDGHTATRYIARFRLVRSSTVCINCFNRQREIEKFRAGLGGNSKGGVPQKWAHLKQATITIEDAAGEWKTLDIGLRSGRGECERYVERIHPGCTLVEVFMGGATVQAGTADPTPADWYAEARNKQQATIAARKQQAKPVDWDDWDTPLYAKPASDDHSDADGNGNARRNGWLPPMSEEDNAAYPASFEEGDALDPESIAAHRDLTADGLPEFVEWLTDGWPAPGSEAACEHEDVAEEEIALEQLRMDDYREAKPSLSGLKKAHGISATLAHYRLRTRGTVEFPLDTNGSVLHTHNTSGINGVCWVVKRNRWCARGYQAGRAVHLGYFDTIDDATAARASFDSEHTEPSTPVTGTIALHEVAEHAVSDSEQTEQESEWAGCCLVRDGVTTYVCDYAKERGISDDEAAIVLGMCDPENSDEPEPAAAPEPESAPEPVKAEPAPKKLTGKQQRKLEKAQRRAERIQQCRPSAPRQIVVTARAYIEVMYAMNGAH